MKRERLSKVYIILGLFLIIELGGLFYNSAIVLGVNGRADNFKVYTKAVQEDEHIIPGDIFDRNGDAIAVTDQNKVTTYRNGYAYSQLIGYTGRRVLSPLAKSVDEVVGNRNDARLMAFLDEDYWGEYGLYKTSSYSNNKGQNAILTIDSNLQEAVYKSLAMQMSATDAIGSAVVMDVKTGEILADVCFPTYDFNKLESAQAKMETDGETTDLEPGYPITYKNSIAPGSIFKMLMAVALIDHEMGDYEVPNTSFTVNGWKCKNMSYKSNYLTVQADDMMDLETALNISSNVYFAKAALELGAEKMNETAENFMMNTNSSYQLTDFGNVKYNWKADVSDDILAQTGFGQGLTEWTTVYAAMVTQAIANDGVMMKPHMVKALIDPSGKKLYVGKAEVLSKATSKETANIVTDYLVSTAKECCDIHNLDAVGMVFDKYNVAGKTGTAENGDANQTNNAWYVSFAPANDPKYVVVVNQAKTNKYGFRMMSTVADIYTYLFEEYQ